MATSQFNFKILQRAVILAQLTMLNENDGSAEKFFVKIPTSVIKIFVIRDSKFPALKKGVILAEIEHRGAVNKNIYLAETGRSHTRPAPPELAIIHHRIATAGPFSNSAKQH